jgi:hypothetical protein
MQFLRVSVSPKYFNYVAFSMDSFSVELAAFLIPLSDNVQQPIILARQSKASTALDSWGSGFESVLLFENTGFASVQSSIFPKL